MPYLQRVIEGSPDIICTVDRFGIVLDANPTIENVLGWPASQVVGESIYRFFSAERVESAKAHFARALLGETLHNLASEHRHRNDTPVSINWSVIGMKGEDALVCIGRDITLAERVERELRATQRQSQVILDSITDAFVSVNNRWCFTYANQQAETLLGLPTESLLGRSIWEAFPSAVGTEFQQRYEEAVRTQKAVSFSGFCAVAHKWLEIRVYPHAEGVTLLLHDISELRDKEAQLQHIAQHDGLTDLPNRRMCLRLLETAVAAIPATGRNVSVLFVDIDLFKTVNDSYGHDAGDIVLVELARRFSALAGAQGSVSRISGDEFVFLLDGLSADELQRFAETLLQTVVLPISIGETEVTVGASVGIASYPAAGTTADELLRNADTAMYAAKAAGRNVWALYSAELASRQRYKRDLEQQIRRALRDDELVLYFQPQISLATGDIIGAEALVRWVHPERGLVMPGDFIPVAEESMLIVSLGKVVIEKTCRQIRAWKETSFPVFPVSVNLSAKHLCSIGLPDFVAQMLEDYELDASRLHLEITESMLMADLDTASNVLLRLQAMGIKVALDDFGTGYSNLAYIKRFPISTLKIDKSFVGDIEEDEDARVLTQAVVSLGKALRLEVLAEGVETEQQKQFLEAAGCDTVQGFHFSRPLSTTMFNDFVWNNHARA
ncbi:putative bifunctional diguanylate cyclase/phosphodiesterase [Paraburkholderia sp. RL17-337-BIB-A]|uniref:putative bifunctional diguanylate cyclase/phosphodiesterase n=1 Tax=Paraburkholderia sp. RL17-337-BIB-A TaxID=3031636 RepID=UPI0038B791F0